MSERPQAVLKDRQQAAQYLNVSVVTLDRKVKGAEIATTRIGRRILFTQGALEEFIESNTRTMRAQRHN